LRPGHVISFSKDVLGDFEKASRKEWIITNGIGGYASSTVVGANARGYHGLLVASLPPGVTRFLLLSKVEEEMVVAGVEYGLSVSRYPGTLHPQGLRYLKEFRLDPLPTFVYEIAETTLRKRIRMPLGQNQAVVTYEVQKADKPLELRLRPLINFRDFHSRTKEAEGLSFTQSASSRGTVVRLGTTEKRLYLDASRGEYRPDGLWYREMIYDQEASRGLSDREDHFSPGMFAVTLRQGDEVELVANLPAEDVGGLRYYGRNMSYPLTGLREEISNLRWWLERAADDFIVSLPGSQGKSIVAGYHWFGEYGRDAAVSLPGLTLPRGRYTEATLVMRHFLEGCKDGLVPVSYDGGRPRYDSVDTSLWFVYAAGRIYDRTGDGSFVREVFPIFRKIVDYYRVGTDFGIRMDEDGLIASDSWRLPLTWMDVRIDDRPAMPRLAKCVEVNALWYNALVTMGAFAKEMDEGGELYDELAARVRSSFNRAFWFDSGGYLYDSVDADRFDDSIRPNQVFSISLPHPVLDPGRWRSVMEAVEGHLYTPLGLRSLSPQDRRYKGRYIGGPTERDYAYHNGSVWAWLAGPFVTAYLRAGGKPASPSIHAILDAFEGHLLDAGLGTISEIFDGDQPHAPQGCISQAWSVAELLRVCDEDLRGIA
jgi:predicted glycogen debranching enzyme